MSIIKDILGDLYNDIKSFWVHEKYTENVSPDNLDSSYYNTSLEALNTIQDSTVPPQDIASSFAVRQAHNAVPSCNTSQSAMSQIAGSFQNNPGSYTDFAPYGKAIYNYPKPIIAVQGLYNPPVTQQSVMVLSPPSMYSPAPSMYSPAPSSVIYSSPSPAPSFSPAPAPAIYIQNNISQPSPSLSDSSVNPFPKFNINTNINQSGPDYVASMILPDGRVMMIPGYEHNLGIFDPCTDSFNKIPAKGFSANNTNQIEYISTSSGNSNNTMYITFNLNFPSVKFTTNNISSITDIYNILFTKLNIRGNVTLNNIYAQQSYIQLNAIFYDGDITQINQFIQALPKTVSLFKIIDSTMAVNNISSIMNGIPSNTSSPSSISDNAYVSINNNTDAFSPTQYQTNSTAPATIQAPEQLFGVSTATGSFTPAIISNTNTNTNGGVYNSASYSPASYSDLLYGTPSGNNETSLKGIYVTSDDPVGNLKINSLMAQWYYNGTVTPQSGSLNDGIIFVPQVVTNTNDQNLLQSLQTLNTADLLTYNASTINVADAVAYWPNLVNTGSRLGSPTMTASLLDSSTSESTNIPKPSGINLINGLIQINISNNSNSPNYVTLNPDIWLDNFLIQLSQQSPRTQFPEFITIQWMGPPKVATFINYVKDVYAKYKLPIWILGFYVVDKSASLNGTTTTHTPDIDWSYPTQSTLQTNATAQFMVQTIQSMNELSYVERYCWTLLPNPMNLLAYPGPTAVSDNYPIPPNEMANAVTMDSKGDTTNMSALFQTYLAKTASLPSLTPLGTQYANL